MEMEKLTFITGGVRSGKSAFAENLAIKHASRMNRNLHYIACGIPFDGEMQERIKRHQLDRKQSGFFWTTWEQPTKLRDIAHQFSKQDIILLDCVTTLLNNYLFQERINSADAILQYVIEDIMMLSAQAGEIIVVSNEVLEDMPYDDALTLKYQSILGRVHQQVIAKAGIAILVEGGIPIWKKGRLE